MTSIYHYFKYNDDEINGVVYLEIDHENYAVKQILVTHDKIVASNRKDGEYHFYLAEGPIDCSEISDYGGSQINDEEFYSVWNQYLKTLVLDWNITKKLFPIGKRIEGLIEVLYPQGILVAILPDVIGVADYNECRENSRAENMYPQKRIEGRVNGYDEVNLWLILGDSKLM